MKQINCSASYTRMKAFTIVELIIVITVIGIIAGIVTVSYASVNDRSLKTQLVSDLSSAADQLELDYLKLNSYPVSDEAVNDNEGFNGSNGTVFAYRPSANRQGYCLQASINHSGGIVYYVTQDSLPKEGVCPSMLAPDTPSIASVAVTGQTAALAWGTVSGATSYEVQEKAASSATWGAAITKTGSTHTYSSLSTGVFHQFRVRALNNDAASDWSTVINRAIIPAPAIEYISWFDCQTHGYKNFEMEVATVPKSLASYYTVGGDTTPVLNTNATNGTLYMQVSGMADLYVWGVGPNGEISAKTPVPESEYCYS